MRPRFRRFGPGFLVTAAFIGPGTVTTASIAGASFGTALVWAVLFATLATIALQEMAARLGIVARMGLGEALRGGAAPGVARAAVAACVVLAIGIGNGAYQMGNVTGAALGLGLATGIESRGWTLLVGAAAFALLLFGTYKRIERWLIGLVLLMSAAFLATALLAGPDWTAVLSGGMVPSIPTGGLLTVVALIGTTVVPYNLFLHAAAAREKWGEEPDQAAALREARRDTALAVAIGGAITLAILLAAAPLAALGHAIGNAADMTRALEPLLGPAARICFAFGLFAAGLTSAITAPLAAAFAMSGVLGWRGDLDDARFRAVWMSILAVGTALAFLGRRPVEAIVVAQAANGLILPLVAAFLVWAVNRADLMGAQRNGWRSNLAAAVVLALTLALGLAQLAAIL